MAQVGDACEHVLTGVVPRNRDAAHDEALVLGLELERLYRREKAAASAGAAAVNDQSKTLPANASS